MTVFLPANITKEASQPTGKNGVHFTPNPLTVRMCCFWCLRSWPSLQRITLKIHTHTHTHTCARTHTHPRARTHKEIFQRLLTFIRHPRDKQGYSILLNVFCTYVFSEHVMPEIMLAFPGFPFLMFICYPFAPS